MYIWQGNIAKAWCERIFHKNTLLSSITDQKLQAWAYMPPVIWKNIP